eukprot:TRINITY_DN13031_c0_g1_i2.p1 TRINITY_DN13031_c0_g1~~TRINITY_DN13031_c0_g1_i2.p1  ORF type:complete len:854 (+),score=186.74 TRINITY_DN13031_c0_g1_i2:101-2662(+)
MVLFAERLEESRIPEWQNYYVNYTRLKGWIHELETSSSAAAAQQFFTELSLSFDRVDRFYNTREDDVLARLEKKASTRGSAADAEMLQIESELEKLKSYAEANKEALRKISKKFDKSAEGNMSPTSQGSWGQTAEWGVLAEKLQPRIINRLPKYRFGTAAERIDLLKIKIEDWRSGAEVKVSIVSLKEPLVSRKLSKLDLESHIGHKDKSVVLLFLASARASMGSILYFSVLTGGVVALGLADVAPGTLDTQSYIVVWITAITLTLLVWQWPSDTVMLGATLLLNLCGLIDAKQAWGGFSNEVVLSVAALSVVGDIVSQTGFVDILFAKIIGQPGSLTVAMLKILIPCAMGAASISNTAVMACCMPAIEEWCAKEGYHTALFFMPISYVMLIAGTLAVFSTSTNLVAQALLVENDLPPFATFELAVPSLICTAVSLLYLIIFTPMVLSRFLTNDSKLERSDSGVRSGSRSWYCRLQVTSQSHVGKTLHETGLLKTLNNSDAVVAIERYGSVVARHPDPDFKLSLDDIVQVRVRSAVVNHLADMAGFQLLPLGATEVYASSDRLNRELAEVCLDQASPLVGLRLVEARTYSEASGSIVAMRVRAESSEDASDMYHHKVIARGDQLILDVPKGFCQSNGSHSAHFLAIHKIGGAVQQRDTFIAYLSGGILCVMLVFVAFSIFPLFPCALGGIFALVLTGCTSVDRAKKAVPLKVVLTIVGAFGLGNAIGQHGVANVLGSCLVSIFAPLGQLGLLFAVAVAVAALGVIFHGTAVVALMFPMCVHIAQSSGIPVHQMIAVLCLSVACQMLSPVSYNTNLMAYAACPEYEFTDFPKLGGPLVILVLVVAIPICHLWFQ